MLAKKIIELYGRKEDICQIKDNGGSDISVKFFTIDEIAFLRVVIKNIIENDSYSYLMNDDELLELYKKLTQSSILYESIA